MLALASCRLDNPYFDPSESVIGGSETAPSSATSELTSEDGDGDAEVGDGDGDGDPGDGDGDPGDGDGDGDLGDGDGDPGDGDGDAIPCDAGTFECDGECVDLDSNDEHCGQCFDPCETGCLGGECFPDPYMLLFVTSELFNGNLGGLEGADDRCQEAAIDAELEGVYMAWISTQTNGPDERMTSFPGDYRTPAGDLVANNWVDLTNDTLIHPIDSTEYGEAPPDTFVCQGDEVWTNTKGDGSPRSPDDCFEWTNASPGNSSSAGWWSSVTSTWTAAECVSIGCATPLPLYCIQQP